MSEPIQTTAEAAETEALPRQREAHAKGRGESGAKPLPDAVKRKPVKQQGNRASEAFDECSQEVIAPSCLFELHAV